jgi:hypothetical protein
MYVCMSLVLFSRCKATRMKEWFSVAVAEEEEEEEIQLRGNQFALQHFIIGIAKLPQLRRRPCQPRLL